MGNVSRAKGDIDMTVYNIVDESKTEYSIDRVVLNSGDIHYEVLKHEKGRSCLPNAVGSPYMNYSGIKLLTTTKSEVEASEFFDRLIRDREKEENDKVLREEKKRTTLKRSLPRQAYEVQKGK